MSEILLAGGMYYSLVYDNETKLYGYTSDTRKISWTYAESLEKLKEKVGGF